VSFYERRAQWERRELQKTLREHPKRDEARRLLGMSKAGFYRALARTGIDVKRYQFERS